MGPGPEDDKEATVLNRLIRWTDKGLEYEADPVQVERLFEDIRLSGECVTSMATPSVKPQAFQMQQEEALLEFEHTAFMAPDARANHLAADRPDVTYAAKEIRASWQSPQTWH